ncbi:DUF3164 family protein [Niabella insulamsoli]|uniref:DUF3164 family protein n=1 Tax=Niabella insulamsoli TaxID=3144874 RepID=UPI0031FCF24D
MNNVLIQSSKNKTWVDAEGNKVPFKFIPATDKMKEPLAASLLRDALKIEKQLSDFHAKINADFQKVFNQMLADYKINYGKDRKIKGAYTWYNFDKSIKIEARLSDLVKWDEAMMNEAREQFDAYLSQNLTEANELIRGLVQSAFSNTKGMIDIGKVNQILKYEEKIKHKAFQRACSLMRNAQTVTSSKRYMMVWVRQADGSYRNINLNFSTL